MRVGSLWVPESILQGVVSLLVCVFMSIVLFQSLFVCFCVFSLCSVAAGFFVSLSICLCAVFCCVRLCLLVCQTWHVCVFVLRAPV